MYHNIYKCNYIHQHFIIASMSFIKSINGFPGTMNEEEYLQ